MTPETKAFLELCAKNKEARSDEVKEDDRADELAEYERWLETEYPKREEP
jgi:hypothetical protein